MATLNEIGQERQKLAERLARLDADRAKLAQQLEELEITERVLARFGMAPASERRRRGRPGRGAPQTTPPAVRSAKQPENPLSLSDATLKAVGAHGGGATAAEVMNYLSHELGMSVRPNHLGIALQRHRRAGRLENHDQRWFLPQSAQNDMQSAMTG
ncbi:MAG TPA: hypothetical protein VL985_18300 [Stellaceae bacterium]|nr:hypothetical protein [Stellaceae bacterium]